MSVSTSAFDVAAIREDFPILAEQRQDGKPLTYLDNAATTQKSRQVIDRIRRFYEQENATVRRGIYGLSAAATEAFEAVRSQVAEFLGAGTSDEIVFTRGCTEAINLVANSWGSSNLGPDDEVIVTGMEHHANLVPWQEVCRRQGATLRAVSVTAEGEVDLEELAGMLGPRSKLLAVTHVSNVLGTVNPISRMSDMAHGVGAVLVVDGAQAVPHMPVDVRQLGADFYAFSGHKIYGPTGVGVLYGRRELLTDMPPWICGGDMIDQVRLDSSTFAEPPHRFEAGTPPIAQVIGLGEAVRYLRELGLGAAATHEGQLLWQATDGLQRAVDGVQVLGTSPGKAAVLSFVIEGVHPYDLATMVDAEHNVAIRTGHHCAQPLVESYGVSAAARASFGIYNSPEEVDTFIGAVADAVELLR